MNKHTKKIVRGASLIALGFAILSVNAAENVDNTFLDSVAQKFIKDRTLKVTRANAIKNEAKDLQNAEKFKDGEKKYLLALSILKEVPGGYAKEQLDLLNKDISAFKKVWSQKIILDAKALAEKNKFEEAIELCNRSMIIDPRTKDEITSLISVWDKRKIKANQNYNTSLEGILPNNNAKKIKHDILIKKAEILMKNRRFIPAKENAEQALIINPYSPKAMDVLSKIYKKLYKIAKMRRENDLIERESEVNWKFNEQIASSTSTRAVSKDSVIVNDTSSNKILKKLRQIVFSAIAFDKAKIGDVVQYFSKRSKKLDPEGINIILTLSNDQKQEIPLVSMTLSKIPMYEAIKYLCLQTGLQFKIEEKGVVIGGENINALETRFFSVRAELMSQISDGATDTETDDNPFGGGSGGGFEDTFDTESSIEKREDSDSTVALKDYFKTRGISFPGNSTIVYDKRARKIVVKNTPDNLLRLEQLLRALDIVTPLVLIESKVLKVSVSALEELGFDVNLVQRINTNANTVSKNSIEMPDSVLRFWTDGEEHQNSSGWNSISPADKGASVFTGEILPKIFKDSSGNAYDLNATVTALDRSKRAENLSAPKVIAKSGDTAIIKMVEVHRFPESYTEPVMDVESTTTTTNLATGVSSSSSNVTMTFPRPEFGDETDVGIVLEVTPTVAPNHYTITLEVNTSVLDLDTTSSGYGSKEAKNGFLLYTFSYQIDGDYLSSDLKMPILRKDEIRTNVKMYDGETIVLGGMLEEKKYSRDDRTPLWGDIPIIGRAFSSKFDQEDKVNMLIFMTSRLINNDGKPVRFGSTSGLPDFGR